MPADLSDEEVVAQWATAITSDGECVAPMLERIIALAREALAHRKANLERVVSAEEALRPFGKLASQNVGLPRDYIIYGARAGERLCDLGDDAWPGEVTVGHAQKAERHFAKFSDPLPPAGRQWRPISEAPKDGTPFLAWYSIPPNISGLSVCWWEPIFHCWAGGPAQLLHFTITAWQPLPDPPPLPSEGGGNG